jgi:hypothetical protein
MKIRPFTIAVVIVGLFAGLFLAVLAGRWTSGSEVNVVLLNIGSGLFATAFISLVLDLFWSRERARVERDELQPLMKDFDDFAKKLEQIEGRLGAFKQLGLNECHGSRLKALRRFLAYAREVVETPLGQHGQIKTGGTIDLVTSSARGLMGYLDRESRDVQRGWRELMTDHPKRFRILLTHPAYAHLRQPAEERASGDIELEVLKTAIYLHCAAGMSGGELRFYRGSPTVFTIQAGRHILLNPYPYGKMAMDTLCLEFDTDAQDQFVTDFVGMHFNHTWAFIDQPGKRVDGKPLVVAVNTFDDIVDAFCECTYLGDPSRLRLTHWQVVELDTFVSHVSRERTDRLAVSPPADPFMGCVSARNLTFSDAHVKPDGAVEPTVS